MYNNNVDYYMALRINPGMTRLYMTKMKTKAIIKKIK